MSDETTEEITMLNNVHRACYGCAFADFEHTGGNDQTEYSQIGCDIGRLDKFKERNEVVEAHNDMAEFYIINRECNTFRTLDWKNKNSDKDLVALAKEEIKVKIDFFLYIDDSNSDEDSLQRTLASLKAQKNQPNKVLVISNQSMVAIPEIINRMKTHGDGLNWKVTRIVERTNDDLRVDKNRAIDIAFGQVVGQFYCYLPIGVTILDTFVSDIDSFINEQLGKFTVLYDSSSFFHEDELHVIATVLHKTLDGSVKVVIDDETITICDNVIDKAVYLAKESKSGHMVKDIREVVKGYNGR